MCLTGGSDSKESAHKEGDSVQSLGWEDSSGEENGYPLQYSCLGNFMDGGYSPWGHKKSDTTKQLTLSHITDWVPGE